MTDLYRLANKERGDTELDKVLAALPPLSANGPWLAGGALRRTIIGQPLDSDFDIFFKDQSQLLDFRTQLERDNAKLHKEADHVVEMTKVVDDKERKLQLVRIDYFESAKHVIDEFDYTLCQLAYDGKTLTTGDYTLWDIGRKRLAVHKITYPVASLRRLLKYSTQGFYACNGCLTELAISIRSAGALRETTYVD